MSVENSTSREKQQNTPAANSNSVSAEDTNLLTELNFENYSNMSEVEDFDVTNCKNELLYALNRPIHDLELKSEIMAVLGHNDLIGDPACHSQEAEDLDEPIVETVSAEEECDESAVETLLVPAPEVAQVKTYVSVCHLQGCSLKY